MRALASCIVALGVILSPAMAGAGGAADKDSAGVAGTNAPATAANAPEPTKAATASNAGATAKPAEASSLESELQQLRGLLEAQAQQLQAQSQQLQEQQQKMLELEAALHAGTPIAGAAVVPLTSAAATAPAGAGQAPPDLGKRIESLESRIKNFGPISFAGDMRLRDEPYFGGPINDSQDRNRERYRARLYMNVKLNNDISGGFAFATGDINDPITSNQTANQDFTRKPFYLDRAFVTYNPHQFSAFSVTGGKFAYSWYRTELSWDNDINPEGMSEKLEWKNDNWHVLRQFALIGFQLPFAETSKTNADTSFNTNGPNALFPYPNSSIKQSVVYGGQIQTRWQLAPWLSFTADEAFYNWHNADAIALTNQQQDAASPALGLLKLNNTLTNSFQTITESFTVPVVTPAGCTVACTITGTTTVASYIVGAKFNSKFAISDTIAQFDIKTPSDRWPIRLLADYIQNTEACANDSTLAFTPAQIATFPADATLTHATKNPSITTSGAPDPLAVNGCDSHDRRGTWLEARFGRQAEKGDWQFAYTHMLIEREAIISVFDFSDMRQGTDVQQNRVEAFYQVHKNVQLGFTGLFGRPLHPAVTSPAESVLKRLQFDVVYKF
jgi:hypothetical protein